MGRGFIGCGSDGEFDGMACLDRVLAVIRERRSLAETGRRAWHGNGDVVDGTDAGELETLAAWFHSLTWLGQQDLLRRAVYGRVAVLYCS